MYVFEHNDGVVHHEADGEHKGQEGHQIHGEAERLQDDERGDQTHRHGHRRNDCRTGRAEEEIDHRHHEHDRDAQGLIDLVDRRLDEHGVVVVDAEIHTLGQGLLQLRDLGMDLAGDVDLVGLGLLDDAHADHGLTIAAELVSPVGRGDLDLGHLAEPNQMPVVTTFEHEAREILGGLVVADDADGELAVDGIDAARRELDVFAPQRVLDVLHGEAAGRERIAV